MRLTAASPPVRLRSVALPVEHGGWSFLLEPLALGLLVAPSAAGAALALSATGMFLARHPLKLAWGDRQRGRRYARTGLAERFVLLYGGIAAAGLALAIGLAGSSDMLVPLLIAAPAMLIQLAFDLTNNSRHVLPELTGPVGLAAFGVSIALAGGWMLTPALVLWALLAARAIPAVLYVRARLRLEREQPDVPLAPALLAHLAGLLAALVLNRAGLAPMLAVIAMGILTARAAYGLSRYRRPAKPKTIGFQELGFGAAAVLLIALGYRLGL